MSIQWQRHNTSSSRLRPQYLSNQPSGSNNNNQSQSPTSQNENTDFTRLKMLFVHYSVNHPYLTNKQYLKFLYDAQLIDGNCLSEKYANILFYSYTRTKNNLFFQPFCDLILKIAELKNPDGFFMNQPNCISHFFETYITPLYEILTSSTINNNDPINNNNAPIHRTSFNYQLVLSKMMSPSNQEVIEYNFLLFEKLYLKYFCFEKLNISKTQKNHLSSRAFVKILRDFEICPYYLNVNKINEVYDNVIKNSEYVIDTMNKVITNSTLSNNGMWFTLYHFIASVYLIAVYNIICVNVQGDKDNGDGGLWQVFVDGNDTVAFQRLVKLMLQSEEIQNVLPEEIRNAELEKEQKLFMSNNVNDNSNNINMNIMNNNNNVINNNVNIEEHINNNIIVPDSSSQRGVINNKNLLNNNNNVNNKYNHSAYPTQQTPTEVLRSKLVKDNDQILKINQMPKIILNKYYSILINVYKFYSELYYETNFSIYMTHNGFIKFLRDIGLVESSTSSTETTKSQKNQKQVPTNITQRYLYSKLRANLLSFNNINTFFSKYSSKTNSTSSNKKLHFENFLNVLLCLSNKIYNPMFNSISYDNKQFSVDALASTPFPIKYAFSFIENYISPLYTDIKDFIEEEAISFENLNVLFSDNELNTFVNKIKPSLIDIIKIYTDGKNVIGYNEYFKLLSDFEIFPDLLTRTKMIRIFINFIDNFEREYIIKGDNKVVLDVNKCVYAIMFIALSGKGIIDNNGDLTLNLLEQMVYFIQRMIQTPGLGKVTIKAGSSKIANTFIKVFNEYKAKVKQREIMLEIERQRDSVGLYEQLE